MGKAGMKRKIFVVGMLSRKYVIDNWLRPMQNLYDVTYVSVCVLCRVMSKSEITSYLLEIIKNQQFDYVFVYADNTHQMFDDSFFGLTRKYAPIISFYSDDEPDYWLNNNLQYDKRYDLIITHSKRGYLYRTNAGVSNVKYVPWGYNQECFFCLNEKKNIDVIFIGSNFQNEKGYYFDGKIRSQINAEIYKFCKDNNYSYAIYGSGWNSDTFLKDAWRGFLSDGELNNVINRARIVVGLGFTPDIIPTYHTKLRHFEIAGSGTFQIVNKNPDLEEIFGDSIAQADGIDELLQKISYYLENEKERELLAEKANRIAVDSCTMEDRIRAIFKYADDFFARDINGNSDVSEEICGIKTFVSGKDRKGLQSAISYLENEIESGITHIRIIDENSKIFDFNYSLIKKELLIHNNIYVSSLFSFANKSQNTMDETRRYLDENAVLITDSIKRDDYWYSCVEKSCLGLEFEDYFIPLSGFVFSKDAAADYLRDYINSDYKRFKRIKKINKIVNDTRIWAIGNYCDSREKKALLDLLKKQQSKTLYIWGVSGFLSTKVYEALKENCNYVNIEFIDKNSGSSYMELNSEIGTMRYRIIDPSEFFDKNEKKCNIVITSVFSGVEIRDSILKKMPDCNIFPLYDMNDAVWKDE